MYGVFMHYGLYRKDVPMFFSSIHADYTKMGYPAAIVRALNFLKHTDLKALSGGRHAIEGDMMYANVDDVETKLFETTKPESHKKLCRYSIYGEWRRKHGLFCRPWASTTNRILSRTRLLFLP